MMKKKILAVIGIWFLLCGLLLPFAGGRRAAAAGGAYANFIDEADILDDAAEASLGEKTAQLQSKYQTNIVIFTVTEMKRDDLKNGTRYFDIQTFTEDYYDFVYCGGQEKDGIILCVNMEPNNREFCVVTTGSEINRFQSKMKYIYDRIYEDLSRTEYEKAAETFVNLVETKHRLGFYPPSLGTVGICAAIGLAAGWLVTAGMKGGMNNVHLATSAGSYMVPGSFKLRRQNEIFLHSSVTQTARQTQNRTGGGGGSIHVGSSGFSHGGGGGHRF